LEPNQKNYVIISMVTNLITGVKIYGYAIIVRIDGMLVVAIVNKPDIRESTLVVRNGWPVSDITTANIT